MRKAVARALIACGDMLIDSCPPATMMSASPCAMDCAPSMAAFRPEPQTLLMVIAGIISGRPRGWRLPRRVLPGRGGQHLAHDDLGDLFRRHPARSSTLRMTRAPRSEAGIFARLPPNLPIAVRAAPTMRMSS